MNREVSLVMPIYGAWDYAKRCAESFLKHTPGNKVVYAIDDGSPEKPPDDFWTTTEGVEYVRFDDNRGLTAGWNHGLNMSRDNGDLYAVCGNSDLVFTKGWYEPLREALFLIYGLVGPVTNAPGHCPWQDINRYGLKVSSDDDEEINRIAALCAEKCPVKPIMARINGFCMMAAVETWHDNSYNGDNVFSPHNRMTGNEDDVQWRFKLNSRAVGYVPRSFVFHYRSVSRPEALKRSSSKGAIRPGKGVVR
jgi:GT2 family glycosyltransferase